MKGLNKNTKRIAFAVLSIGITLSTQSASAGLLTCPADIALMGTSTTSATSPFSNQANYGGSVPASVVDSLDYTHCFGDGSSGTMKVSMVVYQNVRSVASYSVLSNSITPNSTRVLQITGLLPGGSAGVTANYNAIVQIQASLTPGIAQINDCAASAKLAYAFPSKYIFFMTIGDPSVAAGIINAGASSTNISVAPSTAQVPSTARQLTFNADGAPLSSNPYSMLACGVVKRE